MNEKDGKKEKDMEKMQKSERGKETRKEIPKTQQ